MEGVGGGNLPRKLMSSSGQGALRDAIKSITPAGFHRFVADCETITQLSIFVL